MSKDEIGLLLYLESCCVDKESRINSLRMNETDWEIMKEWKLKNFIDYGRVCWKDAKNSAESSWVSLSEEAWKAAHEQRRDRAAFDWEHKTYMTTDEKNA